MRWLLYYLRLTTLKEQWRRTRDLPLLTNFLEYNPIFRNMVLLINNKKHEAKGQVNKIPKFKDILK